LIDVFSLASTTAETVADIDATMTRIAPVNKQAKQYGADDGAQCYPYNRADLLAFFF
jgi:hypothetical protein